MIFDKSTWWRLTSKVPSHSISLFYAIEQYVESYLVSSCLVLCLARKTLSHGGSGILTWTAWQFVQVDSGIRRYCKSFWHQLRTNLLCWNKEDSYSWMLNHCIRWVSPCCIRLAMKKSVTWGVYLVKADFKRAFPFNFTVLRNWTICWILSCLVLSCLVSSCLVLSCLVLSCLVLC